MSTSRILGWQLFSTALASGVLIGVAPAAFANPSGGQVAGGSASISAAPGTTTIDQSSKKAIIDWQRFSIAPGETTRFNQPGSDAIALNRVRGTERSDLFGRLEANGQVWLVNPNGVLIGPGAKIDVGGFLATTADIRDPDFFAGRYDFAIPSPEADVEVVNQGTISVRDSGLAALVAPHARNDGLIEGRYSQVVLAGAPTFAFDFYGDGLINFQLTSSVAQAGDPSRPLVDNAGTIRTEGGRVLMTAAAAGGVVDSVIDVSGVVEARTFAMRDGEIVLQGADHGIVVVAGTLDASGNDAGEHGGTVKVLGEKVALYDGARVDVAGDAGGGTALVGGNFQGKGSERNAKRTYVAKNAAVTADAVSSGDGGKVIVWADEVTGFAGSISARGGAQSGNGGFVEVSGKDSLGFTGTVDLAGPNGNNGSLLLDPDSIVVTADGGQDGEITDGAVFFADSVAPEYALSASALEALVGDVILQANNDISVQALLNLFNLGLGETFSLQAGGNISINAAVTTAGGNIHLEADSPHAPVGGADGVGNINMNASVNTNGGALDLIGTQVLFLPAVALMQAGDGPVNRMTSQNNAPLTLSNLSDVRTTGPITIGRATTRGPSGNGLGSLVLNAGTLTINHAPSVDGAVAGQLILLALGDISFALPFNVNQQLTAQAGGNIAVGAAISTNGNSLHLEADSPHAAVGAADGLGGITAGAPITTSNGSIALLFASPSNLAIVAPVQAGSGSISVSTTNLFGGGSGSDLAIVDQTWFDNLYTTGTLTIGQAPTRGPQGDGQNSLLMTADFLSVDSPIVVPAHAGARLVLIANEDIDVNQTLTVNQPLGLHAEYDLDGLGHIATVPGARIVLAGDLEMFATLGLVGENAIDIDTTNLRRLAAFAVDSNIAVRNAGADELTVANVGSRSGVSAGNGSVSIINADGSIALEAAVQAAGGDIVLVGRQFTNQAGQDALRPINGRFLVYSVDPAIDQTAGLAGLQRFDSSFASTPPDSPLLNAGVNYFLYEVSPETTVAGVPPSVFNPVLSVGDLGESTASGSPAQVVAASAEGTNVVAFAPAQAHLLPQVQRALDESTVDPLYSNDGNRDLWGLATFLSPLAPSPSAEMDDAR